MSATNPNYDFSRNLGSKLGWPFLVFVPWMLLTVANDFLEQGGGPEPLVASLVLGVPGLGLGLWMSFKQRGFVLNRMQDAVTVWVGLGGRRWSRARAQLSRFDRVCVEYDSHLGRDHEGRLHFYRGYYLWLRGAAPGDAVCLWCFRSEKEAHQVAREIGAYTGWNTPT